MGWAPPEDEVVILERMDEGDDYQEQAGDEPESRVNNQPDIPGELSKDQSAEPLAAEAAAISEGADISLMTEPPAITGLETDQYDEEAREQEFRSGFSDQVDAVSSVEDEKSTPSVAPLLAVSPVDKKEQADNVVNLPPYLVPPNSASTTDQVHMITVVVRTIGDKTRDVLRMRRIHGTVMSYPGNDRFAFYVYERGRGYLVEFPNFTTGYCPELISKLNLLVGPENVRVEPITFQ